MAKLILRKNKDKDKDKEGKEGEQTASPATQNPSPGQTVLTNDVIAAIAQAVAVATTGTPAAPVITPEGAPGTGVASTFGDRNFEKLKEVLGDEAAEALLGAFDSMADQSASDASILLQAIKGQQSDYAASMAKLDEKITGMSVIDPDREWTARGYDIFNENEEATLEYLEKVGEAAGPLLGDAVEKFEKAQDEQDYDFLDKVKAGLKLSLTNPQKDHAGLTQTQGVPLTKSEKRKAKEEEDEYNAERQKALAISDPKEKLAAILNMGNGAAT